MIEFQKQDSLQSFKYYYTPNSNMKNAYYKLNVEEVTITV